MKNKPSLLKRIISHGLLLLNIGLVLWSACCFAAAYVSPTSVKYLGLFSLTIPFALLFNLIFIALWLLSKKKKRAFISIVTIVLCSKVFLTVYAFNFFSNLDLNPGSGRIKVMTWNAHGFGIYDNEKGSFERSQMLDYIKEQQPDILCVPEFNFYKNDTLHPNLKKILENNGFKEYRIKKDNFLIQDRDMLLGNSIFSKFPIDSFKVYPLDFKTNIIDNDTDYLLQCDMRTPDNRKIRVFSLHLYSVGITQYDKNFIEHLKLRSVEGPDVCDYDPDFIDEMKRRHININNHVSVFLFKLNYAYLKRVSQAEIVARIVSESPYPVILCGDFNDVPGSYTYTKIKGNLSDAFLEKSHGLGRTYNEILPTLRIDNIFFDKTHFNILGYSTPKLFMSDHKPVIATFEFKN